MEAGTILGGLSFVVSAMTAYASLRKNRSDERSATYGELQELNKTYRQEIDRLNAVIDTTEKECSERTAACKAELKVAQDVVASLRETLLEQANRISKLERRDPSARTRRNDE